MSALKMLFDECKVIAEEEISEVMAINDQLGTWIADAEKELVGLRTTIDLQFEKIQELEHVIELLHMNIGYRPTGKITHVPGANGTE